MKTIGDIDELGRDPKFVAGLADAAFQHGIDMQLLADFAEDAILVPAFESEGRTAPGHAQALHFRQDVEQFLGHAVAEIFVALVCAHVQERQHCDRFLIARGCGARSSNAGCARNRLARLMSKPPGKSNCDQEKGADPTPPRRSRSPGFLSDFGF